MTGFTSFSQCRSGSVQAVLLATALSATLLGCANSSGTQDVPTTAVALGPHDTLIVAGGCFWCVESDFDAISGVLDTTSGYTGGTVPNPTYRQVSAGGTGHREAVRIAFDPQQVTTEKLLEVFWRSIDPTVGRCRHHLLVLAAINLARGVEGVRILASTGSQLKADLLSDLGVSHVLIDTGNLDDELRSIETSGVDAVLDLVGNTTLLESLRMTKSADQSATPDFWAAVRPSPSIR